MQILNAAQIRAWDEFTISNEPIASIDLMERAAGVCYQWIVENGYYGKTFAVFCGKGNNGGDGLAIARLLSETDHAVIVYILEFGHKGTDDFQVNLGRLHETKAEIRFISTEETIPSIGSDEIIIDALFGSGLNRPLEELTASLVYHINQSGNTIISIDIPSGLFVDKSSKGNPVMQASYTLSFQCYKQAFLVTENAPCIGKVHILDIGLSPDFLNQLVTSYHFIDRSVARSFFKKRNPFSHKGDYGYAALVTGSKGMMGAAVLCAKACLRSGVGKLTCHIPECGYTILQVSAPEAMSKVEKGTDYIEELSSLEKYDAVGIGPGIGLYDSHCRLLTYVFQQYHRPIVIDADALNILSLHKDLLKLLPPQSILTPHQREFERLFDKSDDDFERIQLAIEKAKAFNLIIVLKAHHTLVATPSGEAWFNSTGNAGMATGGTGDVLTGIITALLAQKYSPQQAACLGVYVHGRSGDLAASMTSEESLIASDIIDYTADAFRELY